MARKRDRSFMKASVLFLIGLTACQTAPAYKPLAETVSLDEARKISLDIAARDLPPPPRVLPLNPEDYAELPDQFPSNCTEIRQRRIDDERDALDSLNGDNWQVRTAASSLSTAAELHFQRGNFQYAIDIASDAFSRANRPARQRSNYPTAAKSAVAAALTVGRIYTRLDDADEAQSWFARGERILSLVDGKGQDLVKTDYGRLFFEIRDASVARLNKDILEEEIFLAQLNTRASGPYFGNTIMHIDKDQIAGAYGENLLRQRRYNQAEAVTVNAIIRSKQNIFEKPVASFRVLAEALYAQQRYEEAEFAAHTAVRLHYQNCTQSDGLPLVEAYRTRFKILTALSRWQDVIELAAVVQDDMRGNAERFDALYGNNPDLMLARVYTGNAGPVFSQITGLKENEEAQLSHLELDLIAGLAAIEQDQIDQALDIVETSLLAYFENAKLAEPTGAEGVRDGHVEFFRDAYLRFLVSDQIQDTLENRALDPQELVFALATLSPSGTTQKSLVASSARAAAKDPDLADLVRQVQDVELQIGTLRDNLTFLQTAPREEIDPDKLVQIRTQLIDLTSARDALNDEASSRFPDFAELLNPTQPTLSDLRRNLDTDEALVVVRATDENTYVWAFQGQGPIAFASSDIGRQDLLRTSRRLRRALDPGLISELGDIPDFNIREAHKLYRQILAPVQTGWKSAARISLVTDSALGSLPFSLLVTEDIDLVDDEKLLFERYRGVPWLARTHAVSVLPSVSALNVLRNRPDNRTGQRPFAGFGDPFFSLDQAQQAAAETGPTNARNPVQIASRGGFKDYPISLRSGPQTRSMLSATLALLPRLADTRDEVLAIAQALDADLNRDVYLGSAANETSVKNAGLLNYKVISFATHGLVAGDLDGLTQPALALTSPSVTSNPNDDGLLTLGEVLGLRLDADWVVLSACNTGAGDGTGSEAISGLGRAFFYAGTRALLVSHWPVHSAATTALMTDLFLRSSKSPDLSRDEALRRTRLYLINEAEFKTDTGASIFSYAHPIFWAPFTLVGDG